MEPGGQNRSPASVALQPPQPFTAQNLKHPHTTLFDQTGRVDVVPHDVFWDADRRLWFCDIEISHGSAYFPFVRLALARYQPSSLPEMHLSNVVLADFCALAPNRWLTVSNVNPTRRGVRVFGPAPELSAGYAEAFAARSESINNGKITVHLPIEIAKSNIIEVWLEKLSIEHGEDFGWRRISTGVESQFVAQAPQNPKRAVTKKSEAARSQDAATTPAGAQAQVVVKSSATAKQKARANQLLAARDFDTLLKESLIETIYEWPALWSGSIDLPSAPTPNARYRVVVAEYEEYLADGPNPYDENFAATTRRLVFVEHVELT